MNTYLICYGADNEFWLCQADDRDHAIEQLMAAGEDESSVNTVFLCIEVAE